MKKIVLVSGLLIIAATGAFAQKSPVVNTASSTSASTRATGSAGNGAAMLKSGTQLSGQLQSSLDAKNARLGDQVVLKTTNAIKQNGQVIVQKGAKLIGHVTEVEQKAKGKAGSKIGVLFDTLQQDDSSLPINAVITSVVQANTAANVGSDDNLTGSGMSTTQAGTSTRSTSSGSSGGLLGGVGNTVGGVVNTTNQTVGGVTNTAGQTLGSTTEAVGGTVRGLQISQSTNASASGGSTLSLSSGNLRLEKGAMIGLSVSQSSSTKAN
ncbi:MAG: hypothetical protein ABI999_06485 [Acidobacteriota bacterium]